MTTRKFRTRPKPGWIIIFAAISAILLFAAVRAGRDVVRLGRLWGMKHQEEQLHEDAIRRRDELKLQVERLIGDMSYIEEIARRDYGMKRPGEEVFIIPRPDSAGR